MLANESERASFRASALESGHAYVHVLLQSAPGEPGSRFYARSASDPLHAEIRSVVDDEGGGSVIDDWERRLAQAAAQDAICVDAGGDVDRTYEGLVVAIGEVTPIG